MTQRVAGFDAAEIEMADDETVSLGSAERVGKHFARDACRAVGDGLCFPGRQHK